VHMQRLPPNSGRMQVFVKGVRVCTEKPWDWYLKSRKHLT
jgi:hypothetical protein